MKRLLMVLLVATFLSACGSGEESEKNAEANNETQGESQSESGSMQGSTGESGMDQEEEVKRVEDPMEVSDGDIFLNGYEEYKVIETYTNEETTDGFNEVDFQGYHVTYSFKVIEKVMDGERLIGFFAETENNTEHTVQYNADMTLKTSEQEQAENMTAIGETDPDIKTKGMVTVPLEYGVPDSFEATLEPPFKKTGENEYASGEFGEPITVEFTK